MPLSSAGSLVTYSELSENAEVRGVTPPREVELVLDKEAATELVRMFVPVVGRTEIGLLIDSP
ncbi:MAG: hypothetical protein IH918_03895 [Acidobacteria bacterium]|nr:hypothetical protein [Acidobacteriota bacterium]